jgi:indole-3-glycerol phosphate synthase
VSDASSWPQRRFSQAISEGDGISVIPILRGDLAALVQAAEQAGAEALAVESVDAVRLVRPLTELPLLVRRVPRDRRALEAAREAGADACALVYESLEDPDGLLEQLVDVAAALGLDCVLDVRDEEELEEVLERLDPEILILSERGRDEDEVELERTLDLLPDVPVGKLVVSESSVTRPEPVPELARAGAASVLPVGATSPDVLGHLTGRL